MNYWNHTKTDIAAAVFTTIFCSQIIPASVTIPILRIPLTIPEFSITAFWIGVLPHALILTCDLDSETSVVTKMLGPFNIFRPFARFGHREALHHWFWGPFNLVGVWLLPALYFNVDVQVWTIIGAVLMLWCHIVTDMVYSGTKKIMPNWIEKRIKKVF